MYNSDLTEIFRSPLGPLAFFTNSNVFQLAAGKNGFHLNLASAGAVKLFCCGSCPSIFTYLCHYVLLLQHLVFSIFGGNVLSFFISVNVFAVYFFGMPGIIIFTEPETVQWDLDGFSVGIDDPYLPGEDVYVLNFTLFSIEKDL